MKKIRMILLGSLCFLPMLALALDFSDIDSILGGNALKSASDRYASFILFFFPEQTTRMGITTGNNLLNNRSVQQEKQATQALKSVQADVEFIDVKELPADKKIDYNLFSDALDLQQWMLQQNRLQKDPLYYAQAFDTIYDLYLRSDDNTRQRNKDALARLNALPRLAEQARQNLTDVSPFLAQLAMEKAYYAELAFDELAQGMISSAPDEFTAHDLTVQTTTDKSAIHDLFVFFKSLAQRDSVADFRMGETLFGQWLNKKYQITTKFPELNRQLDTHLDQAQHALAEAFLPFETADNQMTVVNGDGEETTVEVPAAKNARRTYTPPTASRFYQLAENFPLPQETDMLSLVAAEVSAFADYLVQGNIIHPVKDSLRIKPLPAYYAYTLPYLFIPADGMSQFFLRIPSGNQRTKQEMLQKGFNTPMRKVMISKQILPGRYYQYQQTQALSNERKLYASPTLQNGWSAFALQLAEENGFFNSAEERLAAAWDNYLDAVKAVVDLRLQTKAYDYAQAWNFLVNEEGFPQEKAEELLRQLAAQPGEALSTVVGEDAIARVYAKYERKLNNKFTQADLLNLFMMAGNVAPADLEKEIKRLYKAHK